MFNAPSHQVFDSLDVFESWFDVAEMGGGGAGGGRVVKQEQERQIIATLHKVGGGGGGGHWHPVLQIQSQNTMRCCLWYSLNSWYL